MSESKRRTVIFQKLHYVASATWFLHYIHAKPYNYIQKRNGVKKNLWVKSNDNMGKTEIFYGV